MTLGDRQTPDGGTSVHLAPAKVNLYLHVTGKRDDGYHLLDSLVVFAGLGDTLTIGPASELRLSVEGPRADGLGEVEDNLVMRAARLLAERRGLAYGAEMTLAKTLPVGAGLGGGSAGAAAALSALIRLWKQNPGRAELMEMALELGADVPVCLAGRASLVSGIGEKLSVAPPLPDAWLVLANPGVTLATPDVFGALDLGGGFSDPNPLINAPKDAEGLGRQLALRRNDLTRPAISFAPGIARVLDELEGLAGCRLARMSGSGATCFALMDGAPEAAAASLKLSRDHRDWWVAAAPLLAVAAPGLTD